MGSTQDVLQGIQLRIEREYPHLQFAGSYSPPFRALTAEEETELACQINDSGANIVFVSLGCPKQEIWMNRNLGQVNAVMLGIGWAFIIYAGVQRRAPVWMRKLALEWLYRLMLEPRRLFLRYFCTNSLFLLLFAGQYFRHLLGRKET